MARHDLKKPLSAPTELHSFDTLEIEIYVNGMEAEYAGCGTHQIQINANMNIEYILMLKEEIDNFLKDKEIK